MTIELNNEYDYLLGNINRMFVTDSLEELSDSRDWAKRRIDKMFDLLKSHKNIKSECV